MCWEHWKLPRSDFHMVFPEAMEFECDSSKGRGTEGRERWEETMKFYCIFLKFSVFSQVGNQQIRYMNKQTVRDL